MATAALLGGDITRSGLQGILQQRFDTSLDALLSRSDPYLAHRALLNAHFPTDLEVRFALIPPPGETVFAPATLAALADIAAEYRAIPFARRQGSVLSYFSPESQRRLFTRPYQDYDAAGLARLQAEALEDRLLTGNLLAADASLAFAVVTVDDAALTAAQRIEIAEAALALRDRLRQAHPGVTVHVNSEVILEQASRQAMMDDLSLLLPLIVLVCITALGCCFRSLRLAACILLYMLTALAATLGLLGLLGFAFNSISIIAPLVVVIIAVANSVHIISLYCQSTVIPALVPARGKAGIQNRSHQPIPTKPESLKESLRENLQPVTLAAFTTAIGFSSLNMSSSPAIQDFGRIVAIGIGFAYLFSFTLLPALLLRFDSHTNAATPRAAAVASLRAPLARLSHFVQRHDRPLFRAYTAAALICIALLPLNETDFNRLDFIPPDSDLGTYYEAVSERMARGYGLTYAIDSGGIDGAIEPAFLHTVDAFLDGLQQEGVLSSAASVADVIKTINRFQHQQDPAYYQIPESIDTIGFQLGNYELAESEGFPLAAFINRDFSMLRLFLGVPALSNDGLLHTDVRIAAAFDTQVKPRYPEAELIHGSGLLLFARMDERVTHELLQGYSLSLALITLSLMVGFRSVYFGLLSVLPNLLPAAMVFGLWGLLVGQLDPFVMMLFSISIGLVVDDTVHILSHYLRARRRGESESQPRSRGEAPATPSAAVARPRIQGEAPSAAVAHAIATAGPALSVTTLILALGTTLLVGADTIYFQQAAKLLVPIVVLALVLDLTYLPGILKRFDRRPIAPPTSPRHSRESGNPEQEQNSF